MKDTNKIESFKQVVNLMNIFLFLSFSGCVMIVFRKIFFGQLKYQFLVWNLFLAWIPLLFSLLINYIYTFSKQGIARFSFLMCLGIVWVTFYPNAPYIITDFIHLSGIQYYFSNVGYTMNAIIWYDFMLIALFILTGFLIGFVSLFMIQTLLVDRFNKFIGWMFACIVLFLSSFGIYLGRFIRWNSWNIISDPQILLKSIKHSINDYAIGFTFSFGLFLILTYCALYYLTNLNEYKVAFLVRTKEE